MSPEDDRKTDPPPANFDPKSETGVRDVPRRKAPGEEKITLTDVYREAVASKEASFAVQEGMRELQRENTNIAKTIEARDERINDSLNKISATLMALEGNQELLQEQVRSLGNEVQLLSDKVSLQGKRQDALEKDMRQLAKQLEPHGKAPPPTSPAKR